jgi:hypothetical protein
LSVLAALAQPVDTSAAIANPLTMALSRVLFRVDSLVIVSPLVAAGRSR